MAYYTAGTRPDGQSRVALDSQNETQLNTPIPLLSNGGAPTVTTFDYPNPLMPRRLALFEPGVNEAIYQPATSLPQGAKSFELPVTRRPSLGADSLSITASSAFWMLTDAVNPGAQRFDLPVTRLRSVGLDNLTIADASEVWMLVDATNAGAQQTELPPRAAARARDYSITASFPLELIGQDAMAAGQQSVELPPHAALRAREYSHVQSVPLNLLGQDAMVVGQQLTGPAPAGPRRASTLSETGVDLTLIVSQAAPIIPCGLSTALTELSPRAALRSRDYSLAASFPLELIGQDAMIASDQLTGPAPDGARRAATLSDPGVNLTLIISQAPPSIPPGLSTFATELAPRGPGRARDYSLGAGFPLELNGKDQFYGAPGEAQAFDWQLPPLAARRTHALYDPGANYAIVQPVVVVALPYGAQSTELPPKAPLRSREYGQGSSFPLELIGKDALPTGDSTAATELPPPGAARARDYSWLQSFPLYVFQQLPPGRSTDRSELPPRAPQRARDYSHLQPLSLELYGQDVMFGRPGEVPTYDWQLPTPAAARMRDYSWTQTFPRGTGTAPRDLVWVIGEPQSSRWTIGAPRAKWSIGKPRE